MHVVLYRPLIPQNTGTIARLCAGTDTDLHLIEPLGFTLDDHLLKRAGLDYWPNVKLHIHGSFEEMLAQYPPAPIAFFSTHATTPYTAFKASPDAWLVYGQETKGLPAQLKAARDYDFYQIPINHKIRSLNLAVSVGITLYHGLSQVGYSGL